MQALTIAPGRAGTLRLDVLEEPAPDQGPVLVRTLAVGICGTDRELIQGEYGKAPPGEERLVLGHESLGRVIEAPAGSGLSIGDTVVGIVRHPDPVPCMHCALGEWDMCSNGLYTERGIRQRHGFAAQRFRSTPEFLVRVNPALGLAAVLLEPASVLAKAWEHIERIGSRARWAPRRVLVTGAGAVGLMAALLGMQRDLEVHLYDRNDEGPKPRLARDLGARYHTRFPGGEFDIVIECTGAPGVVVQASAASAPGAIVCLTGLGGEHGRAAFDVATLNQALVLENRVVFGSVNANRRHYEAASRALERADRAWLERIINRRCALERFEEAYRDADDEVKTVLTFAD